MHAYIGAPLTTFQLVVTAIDCQSPYAMPSKILYIMRLSARFSVGNALRLPGSALLKTWFIIVGGGRHVLPD